MQKINYSKLLLEFILHFFFHIKDIRTEFQKRIGILSFEKKKEIKSYTKIK